MRVPYTGSSSMRKVSMQLTTLDVVGAIAIAAPYVSILLLLAYARLNRARRVRIAGRPAASALAIAFLAVQLFYRPNLFHAIQVAQRVRDDEEGTDDSEAPSELFEKQLERIRRGEKVECLQTHTAAISNQSSLFTEQ